VKPEYVDSLSDQLDLLIVGGYFGKGVSSSGIKQTCCKHCKLSEEEDLGGGLMFGVYNNCIRLH